MRSLTASGEKLETPDVISSGERLAMLSRIREAAEQAKIKLSAETETEIALPFLTPDFSFRYKLTRAELERELWGDEHPQSDSLRSHMHMLRRALTDTRGHAPIETVHGVGYRFAVQDER